MSAKPYVPRVWWDRIEWNRTASVIARELQLVGFPADTALVRRWAKKLGKPLVPETSGPAPSVDWQNLDWSRSTEAIMASTGKSRIWINKMRARYARNLADYVKN